MRICYKEKKFHAKSLALIQLCNEILADMESQGFSITLRQLYYQLVSRAVIENNERSYDNIGAMVSDARLAGLIDWDSIVDRTRSLKGLPHWNEPGDIIKGAAKQFNYDQWEGQPTRVEVWVEKDALADVIGQACNKLDVPFFSCRGYTSQSEMWGAAQRLMQYSASDVVILHFGDHDPSGLDMTRDITDRLEMFCEHHGFGGRICQVQRVALNMDQIEQYNPPPNPAKLTDCRATKYIAEYGHESWELDALSPRVISDLIELNIRKQILDPEKFQQQAERQQQARAELQEIASKYDTVLQSTRAVDHLFATIGGTPGDIDGLVQSVGDIKCSLFERNEQLDETTKQLRTVNNDLTAAHAESERLKATLGERCTELATATKQVATLKAKLSRKKK